MEGGGEVGGHAAGAVVTDGDDGKGKVVVVDVVRSASIVPASLIGLYQSCPAMT